MPNGYEQMQAVFHSSAGETFFSVYHAFEKATAHINRRRDEYLFQQLKKQYTLTLEHQLQILAQDILIQHKNEKQSSEVDPIFHRLIKEYLHRFVQKANAL